MGKISDSSVRMAGDIMSLQKFLESIAQSFFMSHWVFGLLLMGLMTFFSPLHAAMGVLAAALAWLAASQSRDSLPWEVREFGLVPLNGLFFGWIVSAHFEQVPQTLALFMIGSILIPSVVRSLHFALSGVKLPVLILPAILLSTLLSFVDPTLVSVHPRAVGTAAPGVIWPALSSALESVGRWVLFPDLRLGAAISILLLVMSPRRFLHGAAGMGLGMIVIRVLKPDLGLDRISTYAFCSGVVALGLSSLPEKVRPVRVAVAALFAVLLSFAWVGFSESRGLPVLSVPYILAFWGAQLSMRPQVRIARQDQGQQHAPTLFRRAA